MVDVNWSDFSGSNPEYFNPYGVQYPVAPQSTWADGGSAEWPAGSGPGTGQLYVVGSDELSDYDPTQDRLIFGFRSGSDVTEMNAHNYCVLWEGQSNGLFTLHVMPASIWESQQPIASIPDLDPADLPEMIRTWASTNNHFQDDLMASAYSLDPGSSWPDNHIAIQTHVTGEVTTYDFPTLKAVHGDDLVLNFVVMTGRELDVSYDEVSQTMTIRHYGAGWGGYNDVWGQTEIVGVTPAELADLEQLWRYDATNEDGRLLHDRFNDALDELVGTVEPEPQPDDSPTVDIFNARSDEDDGVVSLRVELSEAASTDVTVHWQTVESTAKAGEDYVQASGELVIAAGETKGSIDIAVVDDAVPEGEERVIVRLLHGHGAEIGDDTGLGWIDDDDSGVVVPEVSINNTNVIEGEDTVARFRIDLSEPTTRDVEISYATRNSLADAGSDYQATSDSVTIPAGQTRVFVEVPLIDDQVAEDQERFFVDLVDADGATIDDGVGRARITDDDEPGGGTPTLSIADVTATEGDPGGGGGGTGAFAPGPLGTSGNQILDSAGNAVEIRAVNWFGLETNIETPHGLWTRNWQEMMEQMQAEGFNAIRLPFSTQVVLDGGTPSGIDFSLNPDLQGLSGLEIMDRVVDYAGDLGIRVLLDHHRSEAGDGANSGGLWYEGQYGEADWIQAWTTLAQRYLGDDTVIGADLHNEPHGSATWGDGSATDWAAAAERAGNAIHAVNSDWLIVVEGIGAYQGDNYWGGGNLQGAADHPVELEQDGKLVYSPHDYPASVYAQPWFYDGSDLTQVFQEHWGYIYEQGIAPILLGEFGSRLETVVDRDWADAIVGYLNGDLDGDGQVDIPDGQAGMSWAWWSWNPNSGDTGGVLEDDWTTVRGEVTDLLAPLLAEEGTGGPAETPTASFELVLDAAADEELAFQLHTEEGTAIAGEDYVALGETLVFQPGETSKTVEVSLIPDLDAEDDETFSLVATVPGGEEISATATILDDDGTDPDPDPPTPGGDGDFELDFQVVNDWGSGAQLDVSLTNLSGEAANGWAVAFDLPFEIEQIWSAEIASLEGDRYTVDEVEWNGALADGQTVSFGFIASQGAIDVQSLEEQADAEAFFY